MIKKENILSHIGFSLIAALLYSIPMFYFVKIAVFQDTYLLYIGNILFGGVVAGFMLRHIRIKKEGASTTSMVVVGLMVTIAGVIVSCIVAAVILALFVPEVFHTGSENVALQGTPSQARVGASNGLVLILFMNTIIANLIAGSFVSIILAYSAKFNQTKDKVSKFLKE